MTSAIPVQRSNQLSYQANWELVNWEFVFIPKMESEWVLIYEIHIFELRIKIELCCCLKLPYLLQMLCFWFVYTDVLIDKHRGVSTRLLTQHHLNGVSKGRYRCMVAHRLSFQNRLCFRTVYSDVLIDKQRGDGVSHTTPSGWSIQGLYRGVWLLVVPRLISNYMFRQEIHV